MGVRQGVSAALRHLANNGILPQGQPHVVASLLGRSCDRPFNLQLSAQVSQAFTVGLRRAVFRESLSLGTSRSATATAAPPVHIAGLVRRSETHHGELPVNLTDSVAWAGELFRQTAGQEAVQIRKFGRHRRIVG